MRDDWWGTEVVRWSFLVEKKKCWSNKKLFFVFPLTTFSLFFLFSSVCCELCYSLNLRLHSETGRVAALLYIGDVVTSLTADGFWAVPLVAPPIFVNWIERHRHLAPPFHWLEMGGRCRIQLCATRLRMRSVSEIARRSTESERNSAEQHRPPSIRQSFSHGDVCFYQPSPLDFLLFRFISPTFVFLTFYIHILIEISKFPTQKWVNCYFLCFIDFKCSKNCCLILKWFNIIPTWFSLVVFRFKHPKNPNHF